MTSADISLPDDSGKKRFFYTDPLATAWMAKHFGMRFWNEKHEIQVLPIVDAERSYCTLIHPDSLHLLRPQYNDLVTNIHDDYNRKHRPCSGLVVGFLNQGKDVFVASGERHNGKTEFCEQTSAVKIIQRGGSVFFLPESEAA